jgi:hypothetical protein
VKEPFDKRNDSPKKDDIQETNSKDLAGHEGIVLG